MKKLLLIFFLCSTLSYAEFCPPYLRLISFNSEHRLLGRGGQGDVFLTVYKDPFGTLHYRKLKKFHSFLSKHTAEESTASANFLSTALKDVSGIKAAKYRPLKNPFSKYDVEIEYFEGEAVHKLLKKFKDDGQLDRYTQLNNQYVSTVKKILTSIIQNSLVKSIYYGGEKIDLPQSNEARKSFLWPSEMDRDIEKEDLSFTIELESGVTHWYYLKPDNFILTPDREFVLIDPG